MEHTDRFKFAQDLCERIVQKYGDDIIIGGVFGSTARGNDTAWSDVEMLFITEDQCRLKGKQIMYRDITVGYYVQTRSKLEGHLMNPHLDDDTSWPYLMGVLSILKVLYGNQSYVDEWLRTGESVPYEKFKIALERHLPKILVESYGRILSCKYRNNDDDWYCAVLEVLFEMRDALCLLNKSWVTHDYFQGLVDTFQFSLLPQRYRELVPLLWRVQTIDEAIPLATELVKNFNKLLKDNSIQSIQHTDSKDIPV